MSSAAEIYSQLIAPIEDRMMRTVARLVRDPDDAADAFQNVLMMIWKDLRKIAEHPNPHGYILRACVSASYDVLRKRSRQRNRMAVLESKARITAPPIHPADHVYGREQEAEVLRAIAKLPKQQAQAVLLQVINDENYEEIAKSLGCTEATARSHLSKGKARLREMLSHMVRSAREVRVI